MEGEGELGGEGTERGLIDLERIGKETGSSR